MEAYGFTGKEQISSVLHHTEDSSSDDDSQEEMSMFNPNLLNSGFQENSTFKKAEQTPKVLKLKQQEIQKVAGALNFDYSMFENKFNPNSQFTVKQQTQQITEVSGLSVSSGRPSDAISPSEDDRFASNFENQKDLINSTTSSHSNAEEIMERSKKRIEDINELMKPAVAKKTNAPQLSKNAQEIL